MSYAKGTSRKRTIPAWRYALVAVVLLTLGMALLPIPAALLERPALRTVWWLAQALALLTLPGLALIGLLRPLRDGDLPQTLSLAPIVSLALFPLLLFWLGLAGGRWGAVGVRALLVICAALVVWRFWDSSHIPMPTGANARYAIALGLLFVAAVGVRLWIIQGIAYPAWVDSYHHTVITQLVLERGRVPTNYYPYAELDSFLYHFGYHSYSAFLGWVTGLPAHRAVLWGGQLLNALTVPSLFFFVDRVTRDRRAALVAALLGGLVFRMPAYYVNWGRYPQLAGQVLLPVALALTLEATDTPRAHTHARTRWGAVALAGILVGGLGLTHYRVTIFYLVGLVVLVASLAAALILRQRRNARELLSSGVRLGALGAVALALMLPWLPALLNKTVTTAQMVLAASDGTQYDYLTLDFVLGYGLRAGALIAAGASALWLIVRVRARPLGVLILLGLVLALFLANPVVSGTPSGFLSNGAVIVGLYLPAALLVGLAVGDFWALAERQFRRGKGEQSSGRVPPLSEALLVVSLVALSWWGVRDKLARGIEPWRYLVSDADVQAMQWVREQTPEDALFAIGTDFWQEAAATGNDAGFWLPYIARRGTTIPPMIYINEADPAQVAATNVALHALNASESSQALAAALQATGADYVYLGNRVEQRWRDILSDPSYFESVYAHDGIAIYRVR